MKRKIKYLFSISSKWKQLNLSPTSGGGGGKLETPFFSSFIFLINAIIFYFYTSYTYSILFFCLFVSSLFCHTRTFVKSSAYQTFVYLIDQFFISAIFLYGSYVLYNKLSTTRKYSLATFFMVLFAFFSFFTALFLYHYGYLIQQFCWNTDRKISQWWHSFVHVIGSLGHICIVLL